MLGVFRISRLRKSTDKKPHRLFKNDAQLQGKFDVAMKEIKKRRSDKHVVGGDIDSAIKAVRQPCLQNNNSATTTSTSNTSNTSNTSTSNSTNSTPPSSTTTNKPKSDKNEFIDAMLGNHNKYVNKKVSIDEQNIKNKQQTLEVFKGFGDSLKVMAEASKTNDDYRGELLLFITLDYQPESERDMILKLVDKLNLKLVCIWRAMRSMDVDNAKKSQMIKQTILRLAKASMD